MYKFPPSDYVENEGPVVLKDTLGFDDSEHEDEQVFENLENLMMTLKILQLGDDEGSAASIVKKLEDLRLRIRPLGESEKLEITLCFQKMQRWLQRLRSVVVSRQIKF